MRSDIVPGATFPDYTLPDHTGRLHRLSTLQGRDPMILVLSRGHYCPKDRLQHRNLVALWTEIRVAYTKIVTITTDRQLEASEMRDGVSAEWPFLCDPDRTIQRDLDIAEYTDPHHNPMIPHTLVLAPGLVIHSIYDGYWFWGRPTNEDLRQDLRRVFAQCRPDWDLSAPGLRERYEAGDREVFWPYRPKPGAGGVGAAGGAPESHGG